MLKTRSFLYKRSQKMAFSHRKGVRSFTPMLLHVSASITIVIYNKKGCMTRLFERMHIQDKRNQRRILKAYQ